MPAKQNYIINESNMADKNIERNYTGIEGQHNSLLIKDFKKLNNLKNDHPGAQWFKNAGLGLFLHWGISSVNGTFDLSWSMLTGWEYSKMDLTPEEIEKIVTEKNYNPNKANNTTPAEYFKLAEGFKAEKYNPYKWMSIAKKAGFKYAVLTTRHHDGFALWPSKYGDFSTKNYLGGRDLVREYVDACRKNGIKVGFYYSPSDWYFNRNHMSYLNYKAKQRNPGLPDLDTNHNPVVLPDKEEMEAQSKRFGIYVRGQIDELLTEYGKIDLLWFDGGMPIGEEYPMKRIRELQPGIVVNTRMHADGDFKNCEVKFAEQKPKGWWEYCTIWCEKVCWAYLKDTKYRPTSEIISELVNTRNWGGNFLLNIGPMSNGEFPEIAYRSLQELTEWTSVNEESIYETTSLPEGETCNVSATSKENSRYLFVKPDFAGEIELSGIKKPSSIKWLSDSKQVKYYYNEGTLKILTDNCLQDNTRVIKVII